MGDSFPCHFGGACDSAIIERHGTNSFDVAVTELNGWRGDMEDTHLIHVRDDIGVFGVFDGHAGKDCSKFVARRIEELLDKEGVPEDNATWEKLFIKIDQEFLDLTVSSGTTATICVVRKPKKSGDKHKLHVINAGDSRTLLGKANGCISDGGGTDKGLTRDHKPHDPEERKRIEKAGGCVGGNRILVDPCSLSVSRGFGDLHAKQTGGPGPDNRPVTCIPEQHHFECDETDFVLLVCDGVSEGNFSNADVVQLVAEKLKKSKDGGHAARLVCLEAIKKGSQDNITCMIVQLRGRTVEIISGLEAFGRTVEFIPGSISRICNGNFRRAYMFMAARANFTLAEAVAKRFEVIQEELKNAPGDNDRAEADMQQLGDWAEAEIDLQQEADMLGSPVGVAGSDERLEWAEKWLVGHPEVGPVLLGLPGTTRNLKWGPGDIVVKEPKDSWCTC